MTSDTPSRRNGSIRSVGVVVRTTRVAGGFVALVAVETGRVGYLGAGHLRDVGQRVLALMSPVGAIPVIA